MTESESAINKKTWKEKLKLFKNNITVEPLIIIMVMSHSLSAVSVQTLNYEKACIANANLSKETCEEFISNPNPRSNNETKYIVSAIVTSITTWSNIIQVALPALIILFIGSWSDRTGLRRPCIIIPIFGFIVMAVGLILCTFFEKWPAEVAGAFESVPIALTGGKPTLLLGIFAYLADHTTVEERTYRISILNIVTTVSAPIGSALSGILRTKIGYYGIFGFCLFLYFTAIAYSFSRLKDKDPKKDESENGNKFRMFFDLSNLVSQYRMLTMKRPSNKRYMILMMVAAHFISVGPGAASDAYTYLYAREKYDMNEVEISIFLAYVIVLNLIGVSLGTLIMNKYLKFSDSLMGTIAYSFRFIAGFFFAFGPTKIWFYIAPLIEMFGATAIIALTSLLSKLVERNELGKINSILGISSSLGVVITQPLFGAIYAKFRGNLAGMHINVYGIFLLVTTILFLLTYRAEKKFKKLELELQNREIKEQMAFDNEITSL